MYYNHPSHPQPHTPWYSINFSPIHPLPGECGCRCLFFTPHTYTYTPHPLTPSLIINRSHLKQCRALFFDIFVLRAFLPFDIFIFNIFTFDIFTFGVTQVNRLMASYPFHTDTHIRKETCGVFV
jgi:hypothetical protein